MSDSINISIPKDGGIPGVEGVHALAATAETRVDGDDALEVKVTFVPVGDDALHAGSLEVTLRLTKPDLVQNSDKDEDAQAKIGADYARLMLEVAGPFLAEHIKPLFNEAIGGAVKDHAEKHEKIVEHMATMCQAVAMMLLVKHKGDKDKAKADADFRQFPEVMAMAEGRNLGDAEVNVVIDGIRHAIDLTDVSTLGL